METDTTYELRFVDPERDYTMIADWWEYHEFPCVPKHRLPKLGVLCELVANGRKLPAAAAWLYLDCGGSGMSFLEWPVTKPGLSLKAARAAMGYVVDFLAEEARALGYDAIIAHSSESLAREAEKVGFIRAGQCRVELVMSLCQNGLEQKG